MGNQYLIVGVNSEEYEELKGVWLEVCIRPLKRFNEVELRGRYKRGS